MKSKFLRRLIGVILFSLISGIVVVSLGLMLGWKTSTQFSDGFFWAGILLIMMGMVSLLGYGERSNAAPSIIPSVLRPRLYVDPAERSNLSVADTARGKNLLVFLGLSGLLMFGLSFLAILVGEMS